MSLKTEESTRKEVLCMYALAVIPPLDSNFPGSYLGSERRLPHSQRVGHHRLLHIQVGWGSAGSGGACLPRRGSAGAAPGTVHAL